MNNVDGCKFRTQVKRWDEFTPTDIARSKLLTNHPASLAKSVMRRWLDAFRSKKGLEWFYAAFILLDDDTVGWAAANLLDERIQKIAVIGVYVHPGCRRHGLGRAGVVALLAHLITLPETTRPEIICYQDNMRPFFRPLVEAAGFRDPYNK